VLERLLKAVRSGESRALVMLLEAGWNAGRSVGWQQGWDLRSAVDEVLQLIRTAIEAVAVVT
jgi:hypothetical protein